MHILPQLRERETRRTLSQLRGQFRTTSDSACCKARKKSTCEATDVQFRWLWASRLTTSDAVEGLAGGDSPARPRFTKRYRGAVALTAACFFGLGSGLGFGALAVLVVASFAASVLPPSSFAPSGRLAF